MNTDHAQLTGCECPAGYEYECVFIANGTCPRQSRVTAAVISDPDILDGRPCIAGTRIPVTAIWHFHEDGYTTSEIIAEYPTLSPEQVGVAIAYMMEALAYR